MSKEFPKKIQAMGYTSCQSANDPVCHGIYQDLNSPEKQNNRLARYILLRYKLFWGLPGPA